MAAAAARDPDAYYGQVFRMEGRDIKWSEILKDEELVHFAEHHPTIYTNHWLNNQDRFHDLQMPYKEQRVQHIVQALDLQPADSFVDLTDNNHGLVAEVRKRVRFEDRSYCIGLPLDTLPLCVEDSLNTPIFSDSCKFVSNQSYFDQFNINKVFVSDKTLTNYNDNRLFLQRLYNRLPANGRVLISYRPEHTFLPLFDRARQAMRENQQDPERLLHAARLAGFKNVTIQLKWYDTVIDKETWFAMLRARFFSFLDDMTAEEIEEGIENEVAPKYQDQDEISFRDSFVYFVVEKTSD